MTQSSSVPANVRWLAIPAILVKPVWFVFLIWTTRMLGPAEFGRLMLAVSFTAIVAVLLEGGVDILLVRQLAGRPEAAAALLGRTLPLKLLAGLITVVAAGLAALLWPAVAPGIGLALLGGVVVALGQILLHVRAIFRAFERMKGDAVAALVEKGGTMVLCGAVLLLAPSAAGYLAAQSVALVATLAVMAVTVVRLTGRPAWRTDAGGLWRDVLRPALPFALMNIFAVIYFRSGSLALSAIESSPDDIGYFNAGYRLVEAYMLLPAIIVTPLYPVFVRTIDDRAATRWRLEEGTRAVLFLTVMSGGLLLLFPTGATRLFFGAAYAPAAVTVALMAGAMFAIGMTFVFGTLVAAAGRQSAANRWILAITLINLALNVVLVHTLGLTGAALTTLFTEALLAGANLFVVRDLVPWGTVGSLLARATLALLVGFGVRSLLDRPEYFPWSAALAGLAMLAVLAISRVVQKRDFERLLGRG